MKLYIMLLTGLMLASCGSKKGEGDPLADSPAADTMADAPMPITKDTINISTDTIKRTVQGNDTFVPAP